MEFWIVKCRGEISADLIRGEKVRKKGRAKRGKRDGIRKKRQKEEKRKIDRKMAKKAKLGDINKRKTDA